MPVLRHYKQVRLERLRKHFEGVRRRAEINPVTHNQSVFPERAETIGRRFIETFPFERIRKEGVDYNLGIAPGHGESFLSVDISRGSGYPNNRYYDPYGQARIGFEKGIVTIETFAGKMDKRTMDAISKGLGKPWPQFLLHVIEEHARRCGFKQVLIRNPVNNYWYHHPYKHIDSMDINIEVTNPEEKGKIQSRIKQFIGLIAKQNKYKKVNGNYVKTL